MDPSSESQIYHLNLSACFIGDGSLLLHCAQLWIAEGHTISVIVSDNPSIQAWALTEGIATSKMDRDYPDLVAASTFDYLFSVANLRMLPQRVIAAPTKSAINFHDALLPTYAGIHATAWAILNHESTHGVTWHLMDAKADTGDIVKSRAVPVTPQDTSASLNLRCFEAAIGTFSELIADLKAGKPNRTPQDLSQRTYYGKFQRPADAGLIRWSDPAHLIFSRFRAYEFGQTPNSFGVLKFLAADDYYLLRGMELTNVKSGWPPGTLVHHDAKGLQIATATEDLWITKIQTIDGRPVSFDAFLLTTALQPGMSLPELPQDTIELYARHWQAACRADETWAQDLAIQPASPPYQTTPEKNAPGQGPEGPQRYAFQSRDPLPASIREIDPTASTSRFIFSALLAFLRRIIGAGQARIDIKTPGLSAQIRGLEGLFATSLPLVLPEIDLALTFRDYHATIDTLLNQSLQHGPYARDIFARHPALASNTEAQIKIEFVQAIDDAKLPDDKPFTILIEEATGTLLWSTNPANIAPADSHRLWDQYNVFLSEIAAHPGHDLRSIPILPQDEWRQLIITQNQTERDYPADFAVHQLFSRMAREKGHALAVKCDAQSLSYAQLDEKTNQLAQYLQARHIRKGDHVGIFFDRSMEMIVALLATLKSGAVYIPLDPIYPEHRLSLMIEDSGLACILTVASLVPKLPAHQIPLIKIDTQWTEIESTTNNQEYRASAPAPEDLAYIIYTSGSTGRPKGVQVYHRALTNFLWSMATSPGIGPQDHLAALTTICFDIAGLELYLPLIKGAILEIVPTAVCRDGQHLKEFIEHTNPTIVQATPATWQMLIAAEWEGSPGLKILCGGEPLPSNLAKSLLPRCKELWNLFGPTETTIWSSCCCITDPNKITIGAPIANTQFYVLDAHQNPVPLGLPGELYIGGDGVAAGYLGRPELTVSKFLPDPFHTQKDRKMYRTGDQVRYLADGSLQYICRIDAQIKLRGYRVELGEIEAALEQEPQVAQALVLLTEDAAAVKRILAYVLLKGETTTNIASALTERLKAQLPNYMVPTAIIPLKSFPLLPNGKVDRNALPKPEQVAPRPSSLLESSFEAAIGQIWKETLHIDNIGLHTTFFDAGGDSISLTQVVHQLGKQFNRRFSSTDLFQYPTIQAFAEFLRAKTPNRMPAPGTEGASPTPGTEGAASAAAAAKRTGLRQNLIASKLKRRT